MVEIKSFDNVRYLVLKFFNYLDAIKNSPEIDLFPKQIIALGPKLFYIEYINKRIDDDLIKISEDTGEDNSHMSLICKLNDEEGYYSLTIAKTNMSDIRVNFFNQSNECACVFQ